MLRPTSRPSRAGRRSTARSVRTRGQAGKLAPTGRAVEPPPAARSSDALEGDSHDATRTCRTTSDDRQ